MSLSRVHYPWLDLNIFLVINKNLDIKATNILQKASFIKNEASVSSRCPKKEPYLRISARPLNSKKVGKYFTNLLENLGTIFEISTRC